MRERNYRVEYDQYHGKPEQLKRRATRNAARAKMVTAGKCKKGDGNDVHHVDSKTLNNAAHKLRVMSASKNRSIQ